MGFVLLTVAPVVALRYLNPPATAFMLAARWYAAAQADDSYRFHYRWRDLDEIPRDAAIAAIAAEDQNFVIHNGFDVVAIRAAWEHNQEGGNLRGASSITQQLAKNLFLWSGRSFVRKGLEAWFTILIEQLLGKRRIIELYLNVAQFGRGVYGVDAAAEVLLGKPLAALSADDAAVLAAVLPSPERYSAANPGNYVRQRQAWIRSQMRRLDGTPYTLPLFTR